MTPLALAASGSSSLKWGWKGTGFTCRTITEPSRVLGTQEPRRGTWRGACRLWAGRGVAPSQAHPTSWLPGRPQACLSQPQGIRDPAPCPTGPPSPGYPPPSCPPGSPLPQAESSAHSPGWCLQDFPRHHPTFQMSGPPLSFSPKLFPFWKRPPRGQGWGLGNWAAAPRRQGCCEVGRTGAREAMWEGCLTRGH